MDAVEQTMIVVEPHSFIRGCLTHWLLANFSSIIAVSDQTELTDDDIGRARIAICSVETGWRDLRARSQTLPIILIGSPNDLQFVQGYLPIDTTLAIAHAAIQLVLAGGKYYPTPVPASDPVLLPAPVRAYPCPLPAANTHLIPPLVMNAPPNFEPMEMRVISQLMAGVPSKKTLANKLEMTIEDVQDILNRIMLKLGVQSRRAIVQKCIEQRLDVPPQTPYFAPMEKKIVLQLMTGASNQDIAINLGITIGHIRALTYRIMRKLGGVHTRKALLLKLHELGCPSGASGANE